MFSFVQSTFLQALGHTIANSLWQMAFVWLLYSVLNTFFRFTASGRYRLAVLAQFIGFGWFIGTFITKYFSVPATLQEQSFLLGYPGPLSFLLEKAEPLLPWVSVVYLVLISALGIKWITGYRHTQMIRTEGLQKMPVDWRLFAKKISAQLGLRKEIRIFLSQHVTTPLTIGFLKPVILLPLASINHLTTAQLEAVLLHEMAHIKRHDYLLNLFISVMELVLFFNPFSQLISKSIQKERENSCDDWVLQFQYNAAEYAEGLLRIAYLQTAPGFAMAASGKKNELLFRVKRMIGQQEKRMGDRKKLFALLIVTGMLSGISFMLPSHTTIVAPHTASLKDAKKIQPIHPKEMIVSIPVKRKQKAKRQEQQISVKIVQPPVALQEENMAVKTTAQVDNDNMDKVLTGIKNIDLEQLVTDVFQSAQLTEDDKKELGKIKGIFLSERNRDLLKKEFNEKQKMRLQTNEVAQDFAPITVNVSLTLQAPDLDDEKQVARIKLAILKQLNEMLLNKERKGSKKEIVHL